MKSLFRSLAILAVSLAVSPAFTFAQHFTQTNLVSDIQGMAKIFDPNLKNPWGLSRSSGGPWWISNNNSGTSTLYDGAGNPQNFFTEADGQPGNFVTVPPPGFAPKASATPTGIVFNGSPTDFPIAPHKQATFIFVTEDGTISGWNFNVDPLNAIRKVDNSDKGSSNGAVYKGATSAEINGKRYLYVTNFRSGHVEIYDTTFKRVHLGEDAFEDESVPRGFAPFNIQNIGGSLFVTYAKQDAARHDDVAGDGLGRVLIFSPTGRLEGQLEHGPWLNSPWGAVWAPRDFGEFSNVILIGNFGSGRIAAFNGFTHKFIGFMKNATNDSPIVIDGLWSLTFGNGGGAGSATALFFSAGLNGEQDGLFGTLTPIAAEQDGDEE
jgi:uncharacterized protein (TIGR03118 family)